jgi:hypothetical protein
MRPLSLTSDTNLYQENDTTAYLTSLLRRQDNNEFALHSQLRKGLRGNSFKPNLTGGETWSCSPQGRPEIFVSPAPIAFSEWHCSGRLFLD